MDKIKNKSGITLIALVVTIIVLLILAGISIQMLTGDNGIINNAQEASIKTESAKVDEEVKLAVTTLNMEITQNKVKQSSYNPANFIDTNTDGTITVAKSCKEILEAELTDSNYEITKAGSTGLSIKYESSTVTKEYTVKIVGELATLKDTSDDGDVVDYTALTVGDYISNYPVYYNNVSTFNGSYTPRDEYANNWRVLSTDGGTVKLVSAGVPLTFYHPYETNGVAASVIALTTNFFANQVSTTGNRTYRASGFKTSEGTAVTTIDGIKELFKNDFTVIAVTGDSAIPSVQSMTKDDLDGVCGSNTTYGDNVSGNEYNNLLAIPCKDDTSEFAITWLASIDGNSLWGVYSLRRHLQQPRQHVWGSSCSYSKI